MVRTYMVVYLVDPGQTVYVRISHANTEQSGGEQIESIVEFLFLPDEVMGCMPGLRRMKWLKAEG